MTKLFLVRHGQDADNVARILNGHRDGELTELGRAQARESGEELKGENIDAILSSPLRRAKETADIIAGVLGMKAVIEPLLIERDFGELTGKPVADVPKLAKEILSYDGDNFFLKAKEAEDFPQLYARAERFLEKVKMVYSGKTVLAVSHGDIGKMIRAAWNGWTWKQGLETPHFGNAEIVQLD